MAFDFKALDHHLFMRAALKEAELAYQSGERPIGAVIVQIGLQVSHLTITGFLLCQ